MKWRYAAFLLGLLWLQPALARADSFDPLSFGVHAGTLGYGINLERPLLFDLSARASLSTLSSTTQRIYDKQSLVVALYRK